ncbi:hypothetical protein WG66_011271 [Moniliophthora roreri]|nr:hypothetical protein WG66_011271 [Moniliophthora roreri]
MGRRKKKNDGDTPANTKPTSNCKAHPALPPINWTDELIHQLLTIIERPYIRKKIIGTEDGNKEPVKTDGASKNCVYGEIAKEMFLEMYATDSKSMISRIGSKISNLQTTYQKKAEGLKETGGGLKEDVPLFVPSTGPDHDTCELAQNLWNKITNDWPFFPRCHNLWATCIGTIPPVTTTGVGPNGRSHVVNCPVSRPSSDSPQPDGSSHSQYAQASGPGQSTFVFPTPHKFNGVIDPALIEEDANTCQTASQQDSIQLPLEKDNDALLETPVPKSVSHAASSGPVSGLAQKANQFTIRKPQSKSDPKDELLAIAREGMEFAHKHAVQQLRNEAAQLKLQHGQL